MKDDVKNKVLLCWTMISLEIISMVYLWISDICQLPKYVQNNSQKSAGVIIL
jgi:hypothetical protein